MMPYTEARHRALIAVHCAARKRSFNSVADPEHLEELQLVSQNLNVAVPSPHTVQRDVERLYEGFAPLVTAYFKVFVLTSNADNSTNSYYVHRNVTVCSTSLLTVGRHRFIPQILE